MHQKCRLHIFSFALACAVVWAIFIFAIGFAADLTGYGRAITDLFNSLYIGFAPTIKGCFIGAAWAFVDAFIGGLAVAWLYNAFCSLFGNSSDVK